MKKRIAWLLLAAIAVLAAPVSHASTKTTALWSIDGTQPPQEPQPGR